MLEYDRIERRGTAAAVILHPHPDMGGDRHHPVVDSLYRGLPVTTLRFDFASSSLAEAQEQVHEALEVIGGAPVVLAGYSFGAGVALTVDDPRILGWFLVAPALRESAAAPAAADDARPKLLTLPEHDQFSPPERVRAVTASWTATTLVTIPGADHFLMGRADAVLGVALDWLPSILTSA